MNVRRFGHFELLKIIFNIVYLMSGLLMLGALISNASNEYKNSKTESHTSQQIDCMNCDEID